MFDVSVDRSVGVGRHGVGRSTIIAAELTTERRQNEETECIHGRECISIPEQRASYGLPKVEDRQVVDCFGITDDGSLLFMGGTDKAVRIWPL